MNGFDEVHLTIRAEGLALEGLVHEGDGSLAGLVLHPHPQYGGDMHNHVVETVCRTLAERGATTLRYNSRGAGASEGEFDNGRGEAQDARAAAAVLFGRAPEAPLVLCGYSFGAMVASVAAPALRPRALLLISPPISTADLAVPDGNLPTLMITGSEDSFAPAERLRALASASRQVVEVPGVDHGWWPGADELAAALRGFLDITLT